MNAFFRYLCFGSEELTMPRSWLANRERLKAYTGYTMRQLQQGSVVRDTAATARDRFWQRIEAQHARAANVATFRKAQR